VCLTATNSCGFDSRCDTISITSAAIGMAENYLENGVNIYPNPNSGEFTIDVSFPKQEDIAITIYNLLGEIVYKFEGANVQQESYNIDLNHLNEGAYIIKVQVTDGFTVRELILSK